MLLLQEDCFVGRKVTSNNEMTPFYIFQSVKSSEEPITPAAIKVNVKDYGEILLGLDRVSSLQIHSSFIVLGFHAF